MMGKHLSSHFMIDKIENNENFQFEKNLTYTIQQMDIINSTIFGEVNSKTILEKHNFIETAIHKLKFSENNLEACDFIDCSIEDSEFYHCNMIGVHINSSVVKETKFINCVNSLTNFNKSDFYSVTFNTCDFSRLLIKDCKFYNCKFINCITTNKIFESCIFFNSEFENMEIQIQTIFDNMGINNNKFINISCRTARTVEDYILVNIDEVVNYSTNSLQRLNSLFFMNGTNEDWYLELYNLLDSNLFYQRKKTPESLMNFLEKLSEFLILLYENNIICLHPIIKFHYLTFLWTEKLEANNNTNNNIYKILIGLHMIHTRYVETFLIQLYSYLDDDFKSISLILRDDYINNKDYYIQKLSAIFKIKESNILEINPYNSVELVTFFQELYQYAPILALALSTRLKIDIQNLSNKLYLSNMEQIKIREEHSKLFNLELGRGKTKDILFALKMQAMIPNNILINLALDLDGKKVSQVHNYIIKFFKNFSQKSL